MHALVVVKVAILPWPWGPFKCRFKERFDRLAAAANPEDEAARSAIFATMVSELSAAERQQCRYHQTNWTIAAGVAVTAWCGKVSPDDAQFEDLVTHAGGGPDEWLGASSFFSEPIFLQPADPPTLGNGQHRVCAMKCAGVEHCLIEP